MKNNVFNYVFLLVCLMAAGCLWAAEERQEELPDSLLTDDYVYEYTYSDYDKAVRIMKELRKRETLSQYRMDMTEGDLYFNAGRYLQALKYYKRVMESDSVKTDDKAYMEQAHRMVSCYDCLHDEARKATYVKLLLQKAEQCGNLEMKSIALFNMGKMLYYQEDKPRGYQLVKEAIDLMKQTDYKYKYDNLRYDYNSLFIMQQRDKRYEEALATLNELEKVVTESTDGEPGIDGLAEKEKKTMYAHRAVILSRLGRTAEADRAYADWETIGKAYTKDDYLVIPYLMDRKMYDKVVGMYTSREAFLYANNDTINYHMMTIKRTLGKAWEGKGDYRQAARYYEALAILTDSLKVREQQSSAIELATVYETQEREAELQEQTEQVKIRNLMLLFAVVILVVLLVLFLLNVRHTRTIRRKNTAMVATIHDLLSYKDELDEAREKLRESEESTPPECEETIVDTEEEEKNRLLFEKLDSLMTRDKLYLNPDLSRDDFVKLTGVNKTRVGRILQQNTGLSTTGYINKKRLEYAVKLLKSSSDHTIPTIAEACGLPNVPTFNRLFRSKFGMTPTEYKKTK